jgi:hypothetical protein
MEADRKTDREQMKQEIRADRENLKEMREEIKSGQAKMRSILNAWTADMKKDRKETRSQEIRPGRCGTRNTEWTDVREDVGRARNATMA